MLTGIIKKGEYFDSVSLMLVDKEINQLKSVKDATVVMGTKENKAILKNAGLYLAKFDACSDTDLLIALNLADGADADAVLTQIGMMLKEITNKKSDAEAYFPKSLEGALEINPAANLVLISLAGKYAGDVAAAALKNDKDVMLFSDNVPLEREIELKKYALEKELLMMGPDCGTAIINGVPLAFANVVKEGNIGIVAASGTGLQEVSSLISNLGGGISQAIGTGGRDIKQEVGGLMFIYAMKLLQQDENTEVIVLIAKPPHPEVLEKINSELKNITKPVVTIFLGEDTAKLNNPNVKSAQTLEEAALLARKLSKNESVENVDEELDKRRSIYPSLFQTQVEQIKSSRKYVRGLFSGGTLCDEAQLIFRKEFQNIYSNRAPEQKYQLPDPLKSKEHTVLDLGEDEFTVGRLHPMIDFTLRNQRIVEEARDPETAIILLDIVLGYGANQEPVKNILPTLKQAQQIAPEIIFIGSVVGTEEDPQNREEVIRTLEENGMIIMPSNAAAAELTLYILQQLQKDAFEN